MPEPNLVPVFDQQGNRGWIPEERLPEAVRSGDVIPGVRVVDQNGNQGTIPSNRMTEALQSGELKIQRFEDQPIKHPGFWKSLWDDVSQYPGAMLKTAGAALTPPGGTLVPGQLPRYDNPIAESLAQTASNYQARTQAGNTLPYRVGAAIAETAGTNVTGMEQEATAGNPAGVAGHASAVPLSILMTEGAAKYGPPATRGIIKAAQNETAAKIGSSALRVGKVGLDVADVATFNRLSEAWNKVKGGARDVSDIWQRPLDATKGNVPYAGELEPTSSLSEQVQPVPSHEPTLPKPANLETRTLSGESALRQILTGQDYQNLMKIAKSRGINVSQEAQLRPGVADPRLISKIVDDFSPDELADMRATYMETERFKHNFGDITPEAWKTLSLQNYFPDVKITQAALKRTQASIAKGAPQYKLSDLLSVK